MWRLSDPHKIRPPAPLTPALPDFCRVMEQLYEALFWVGKLLPPQRDLLRGLLQHLLSSFPVQSRSNKEFLLTAAAFTAASERF